MKPEKQKQCNAPGEMPARRALTLTLEARVRVQQRATQFRDSIFLAVPPSVKSNHAYLVKEPVILVYLAVNTHALDAQVVRNISDTVV